MYKLLIADDESEIRNGLSQYYPWHEVGFDVVGQVEDGRRVLNFIAKHPVDVLLCDIKMPFMSGIDVAKDLFEQNSEISVILLSGYREFEFAHQALNYGVKHYLLKPTKYTEITKVFERIKEDLDQKKGYLPSGEQTNREVVFDQAIDKIKEYINEHYREASLEKASKVAHMNPYYLSKYFKQKTGENFSEYLTQIRMKKAAELLRDFSYKTYEVSDIVGYSNAKNFTRTFRRFYGQSPREFRNSNE